MSEFQSRYVCENTKFYELNIDPVDAGTSGKLTIASGHTQFPLVPDQQYSLVVDTSGHLVLSGQSGNPSPAIQPLDISPDGDVSIQGNTAVNISSASGVINAAGQIKLSTGPADSLGQASASLAFLTDNSGAQYYTWYASNGDGGGLSNGHLQLFSYNNSTNWVSPVIDVAPQTATNPRPTITFNAQLFSNGGQALGPVSRQYPSQSVSGPANLPGGNAPLSIYTFDLSGFANKLHYIVNIDAINFTATPGSSNPVTVSFYLCDTPNGAKNTKACLAYTSGALTSGQSFSVPSMNFIYTGSTAPGALFLNAVVTTSTGPACQLNSITFNASIVAP